MLLTRLRASLTRLGSYRCSDVCPGGIGNACNLHGRCIIQQGELPLCVHASLLQARVSRDALQVRVRHWICGVRLQHPLPRLCNRHRHRRAIFLHLMLQPYTPSITTINP